MIWCSQSYSRFFFFNDTATTEIYTLSLHDALPISRHQGLHRGGAHGAGARGERDQRDARHALVDQHAALQPRNLEARGPRSEEHTSELQSRHISYAVFCL